MFIYCIYTVIKKSGILVSTYLPRSVRPRAFPAGCVTTKWDYRLKLKRATWRTNLLAHSNPCYLIAVLLVPWECCVSSWSRTSQPACPAGGGLMKICHIWTQSLIRKKNTPEKRFSSLPGLKVLKFSAKNLWNEPTFFLLLLFPLTIFTLYS